MKNPNKAEEAALREPLEIMDEISRWMRRARKFWRESRRLREGGEGGDGGPQGGPAVRGWPLKPLGDIADLSLGKMLDKAKIAGS